MNSLSPPSVFSEIEAFVDRFETALLTGGDRDLARFLPVEKHPLYPRLLSEFIRIDLEYGWERGCARRLADYQKQFPAFFQNRTNVQAVAFEEYRLRRRAGESPSPQQYAQDFGVDTSAWSPAEDQVPEGKWDKA